MSCVKSLGKEELSPLRARGLCVAHPLYPHALTFKTWHLLSLRQDPPERKNVPEDWTHELKAQYIYKYHQLALEAFTSFCSLGISVFSLFLASHSPRLLLTNS